MRFYHFPADSLTRTYTHTGITVGEVAPGMGNTCDYCQDNGVTVKANFATELRFRYNGEDRTSHTHTSLCAGHLVAYMENYRDMAIEGAK